MASTAWFKIFVRNEPLVNAATDADAGRAIKAAMSYASGKELPPLDGGAALLFAAMKPDIDACMDEYNAACERNRENIKKRWSKKDSQKERSDTPMPQAEEAASEQTEAEGGQIVNFEVLRNERMSRLAAAIANS